MRVIQDSPEHHFLTFLEKVKQDGLNWAAIYCAQSETLKHGDLIDDPKIIPVKLQAYKKECTLLLQHLTDKGACFSQALLYHFTDGDLLLLVQLTEDVKESMVQDFYRELVAGRGGRYCRYGHLSNDIYTYHRLADERLVSARRMAAYEAMTEEAKINSISLRRDRRRDTLVMIVEDDRFTAAYASNILNKDCEIVHAKTGEDAIISYIEHAPDIVFQDIHLPGISGHETLNAIRKIDPAAYIIMLSVDAAKTTIVEASKGGASGFLKKPFTKERMLAMVKASPFYKAPRASAIKQP